MDSAIRLVTLPKMGEFHEQAPSEMSLSLLHAESPKRGDWPASPRRVKHSWFSILVDLVMDATLLVLSLAFLAFALTVRHYDSKQTALHPHITHYLQEGAKYGPTIFPLLFACVVSRATHAIMIWRLERGASIGTLDLLAGSTSLTSTVTSQLQLRTFSLLGPVLLAIWSLSPLGGQASIRMMSLGNMTYTDSTPARYPLWPKAPYVDTMASGGRLEVATFQSIMAATLLSNAASYNATMDLWGNVKMPYIEAYEAVATPDADGWYSTDDPSTIFHSSLVGLPVSGIDTMANTSAVYQFNPQWKYLNATCEPSDNIAPSVGYLALDYPTTGTPRIFNWTWDPRADSYHCHLTTTYIEAAVSCSTQPGSSPPSCLASAVRRSRLDTPAANLTDIDELMNPDGYLNLITTIWIGAMSSGAPNPLVGYFMNPGNITLYQRRNLTTGEFSRSLSRLLNTWTMVTALSSQVTSGSRAALRGFGEVEVPAIRTTTSQVMKSHSGWVLALVVASAALILACLIRPILRTFFSEGPDLLLNISSLATRDNEYVALPTHGSYLDAVDRAKLLKKTKVRFGDAKASHEIGRLVIGDLNTSEGQPVRTVRKNRIYE